VESSPLTLTNNDSSGGTDDDGGGPGGGAGIYRNGGATDCDEEIAGIDSDDTIGIDCDKDSKMSSGKEGMIGKGENCDNLGKLGGLTWFIEGRVELEGMMGIDEKCDNLGKLGGLAGSFWFIGVKEKLTPFVVLTKYGIFLMDRVCVNL